MSGDHNMNQRTTGIHEQKFYAEQSRPIMGAAISGANPSKDVEPPKLGNIQDQMGHMENHIHFLMNAIDTLESRLHMVLRDEPGRPEKEETVSAMSPLAHALYTFNRRLDKASRNILSLVERLEI